MQPTSPRLSSDPSAQPGYAPIAWAAVAALGIAILFVITLGYLSIASFLKGLPLTDSWIPFVPALVMVLAFVARRQIRASEGTRTGEVYANAAWWMAVLSLVVFLAALEGNKYTVQLDAKRAFASMADSLKDVDAFNPKDTNLIEAAWITMPPGARPANKKDTTRTEAAFADAVSGFRQTDIVRLTQRNKGKYTLTAQGLKDWSVKPNEIECTLTAQLVCPEGNYGLELPMRAAVDDKGGRRWQIKPAGAEGYVKTRNLTRLGWEMLSLEADGLSFGRELLLRMAQMNQAPLLYLGYVHPGWEPNQAAESLNTFVAVADPLAALTGAVSLPAVRAELPLRDRQPLPPGWYEALTRTVFTKPDGSPLTPAETERFWRFWSTSGSVLPTGTLLKGNSDVNAVLVTNADTVEIRLPVEMPTGGGGAAPSAYKGRLVFRLPAAAAAPVLAMAQKATPNDSKTTVPPPEVTSPPARRPWRLVRFETDLKPVQGEAPQRGAAPGG